MQSKPKNYENKCYRCGSKDYWPRIYFMPTHLVDLYPTSIRNNEKKIKSNFVDGLDPVDLTNFDASYFFEE